MAPERRARFGALEGWVWNPLEAQWEDRFQALLDYVEREGNARVPARHCTPKGYNLGNWINQQRTYKDRMTTDRRARLEALEGWTWNTLEAQWEERFDALCEFVQREGHARVPRGYSLPKVGYKLGIWVGTQRRNKDKLSPDRRARLEALAGWVWSTR